MTMAASSSVLTVPRLVGPYEVGHEDHETDTEWSSDASPRTARVSRAFGGFMEALGLDAADPHLEGTASRVARAYEEMFRGLSSEEPELRTFPNEEGYASPVSVNGIPFYSLCAHHFLPFFGEAHIAYVPSHRLVGLSKLPRTVEFFARRPQVQERLTDQVADLLDRRLQPAGVMVVLDARHLCMEMRGVRSHGTTRTIAARGVFTETGRQHEFLNAITTGRTNGDNRYATL